MKMIMAVVQPFMLSKLMHALESMEGFPGMTVTDARGFGREKAAHHDEAHHRRMDDIVDYVKKERIEIAAHDEMVERIVETIVRTTHTGNPGDGKIFVWPLESAVRITTKETGEGAL